MKKYRIRFEDVLEMIDFIKTYRLAMHVWDGRQMVLEVYTSERLEDYTAKIRGIILHISDSELFPDDRES